jgi:hypothetical protein
MMSVAANRRFKAGAGLLRDAVRSGEVLVLMLVLMLVLVQRRFGLHPLFPARTDISTRRRG